MKKKRILAIILIILTLFLAFASIVFGEENERRIDLTDYNDDVR